LVDALASAMIFNLQFVQRFCLAWRQYLQLTSYFPVP
jgi:hypothetical protein